MISYHEVLISIPSEPGLTAELSGSDLAISESTEK